MEMKISNKKSPAEEFSGNMGKIRTKRNTKIVIAIVLLNAHFCINLF